jgi:hypothetical protein
MNRLKFGLAALLFLVATGSRLPAAAPGSVPAPEPTPCCLPTASAHGSHSGHDWIGWLTWRPPELKCCGCGCHIGCRFPPLYQFFLEYPCPAGDCGVAPRISHGSVQTTGACSSAKLPKKVGGPELGRFTPMPEIASVSAK